MPGLPAEAAARLEPGPRKPPQSGRSATETQPVAEFEEDAAGAVAGLPERVPGAGEPRGLEAEDRGDEQADGPDGERSEQDRNGDQHADIVGRPTAALAELADLLEDE